MSLEDEIFRKSHKIITVVENGMSIYSLTRKLWSLGEKSAYYWVYKKLRLFEKYGIVNLDKNGRTITITLTERGAELKNFILRAKKIIRDCGKVHLTEARRFR